VTVDKQAKPTQGRRLRETVVYSTSNMLPFSKLLSSPSLKVIVYMASMMLTPQFPLWYLRPSYWQPEKHIT